MTTQEVVTLGIAAIGAASGLGSLLLHWRQSRFALHFESVELRFEPDAVEQLRQRSPDSLTDSFFDFEVELAMHNRRSGSGSIEKPRLEVKSPDGLCKLARPDTEAVRSRRDDQVPNMTHIWVERYGLSYFFSGHERRDDALQYVIDFPDGSELHSLLNHFEELEFALVYRDNKGRTRRHLITDRRGVDTLI